MYQWKTCRVKGCYFTVIDSSEFCKKHNTWFNRIQLRLSQNERSKTTKKKWWQRRKKASVQNDERKILKKGKIIVCGYTLTPGSKLYESILRDLNYPPGQQPETSIVINDLPDFENSMNNLLKDWIEIGRGVVTDQQRRSLGKREKEIGYKLNNIGGIELMRSFANKLINSGLSYESDFHRWHGIGEWQN